MLNIVRQSTEGMGNYMKSSFRTVIFLSACFYTLIIADYILDRESIDVTISMCILTLTTPIILYHASAMLLYVTEDRKAPGGADAHATDGSKLADQIIKLRAVSEDKQNTLEMLRIVAAVKDDDIVINPVVNDAGVR
jgi:hypothetical protein